MKYIVQFVVLAFLCCAGGCCGHSIPESYKIFQISVADLKTGQPVTTGKIDFVYTYGGMFCKPITCEALVDGNGNCALELPTDRFIWVDVSYWENDLNEIYVAQVQEGDLNHPVLQLESPDRSPQNTQKKEVANRRVKVVIKSKLQED
jgi:hypothetical protein